MSPRRLALDDSVEPDRLTSCSPLGPLSRSLISESMVRWFPEKGPFHLSRSDPPRQGAGPPQRQLKTLSVERLRLDGELKPKLCSPFPIRGSSGPSRQEGVGMIPGISCTSLG
jgi:hypothetical protein